MTRYHTLDISTNFTLVQSLGGRILSRSNLNYFACVKKFNPS